MAAHFKISIDQKKCTGCGVCVDACPVSALAMKDGLCLPVEEEACMGFACESCLEDCPSAAIEIRFGDPEDQTGAFRVHMNFSGEPGGKNRKGQKPQKQAR